MSDIYSSSPFLQPMELPPMEPEAIVGIVVDAFNSRGLQDRMDAGRVTENAILYKSTSPFQEYYIFAVAFSAKASLEKTAKLFNLPPEEIKKISGSALSRLAMGTATYKKAHAQISGYARSKNLNIPSLIGLPQKAQEIKSSPIQPAKVPFAPKAENPRANEAKPLEDNTPPPSSDTAANNAAPLPGIKRVKPNEILLAACRVYSGIKKEMFLPNDVMSDRRAENLVYVRHFVFYAQAACLPQSLYSMIKLGKVNNPRLKSSAYDDVIYDHTTILHGVRKFQKLIDDKDKDALDMVDGLIKDLNLQQRQIDGLNRVEKERFADWPEDPAARKPSKSADAVIEPKPKSKPPSKPRVRISAAERALPEGPVLESAEFQKLSFAEIFGAVQGKYKDIAKLDELTAAQQKFISDFAVYATLKLNPEDQYSLSQVAGNVGEIPSYASSAFETVAIGLAQENLTLQKMVEGVIESFPMSPDQADLLRTPNVLRFQTWDDIKRPVEAFSTAVKEPSSETALTITEEKGLDPSDKDAKEKILLMDTRQIIDATLNAFREEGRHASEEDFFKDGRSSEDIGAMRALAAYVAQRCLPSKEFQLKEIAESLNKTSANAIAGIHRIEDLLRERNITTKQRLQQIADRLPLTKEQRRHLFLDDTPRFIEWQDIIGSPPAGSITAPAPSQSPEHP